jgi:pimeloyl-ACP methyl ester carboxylesterase
MRSRSNHRPLRFALDVLVVMALAAIAIGCSMRRQFSAAALNPSSDFDLMPADLGLEAETVWVAVEGAALHLWIFHARQPVATVVFCNGNSGNKGVLLPLIPAIIERGYDAVLFDYRGFGLSSGDADVYSLADDTIRVVDLVRSRAPAQPLALLGTSLGSVAAIVTAKERPDAVDALVLESLLDSRASCRSMLGPVAGPITCRQLVPAQFDTRKQLSQLRQPVLVLHGDEDQLTPLRPAARMLAHGAGGGQPREFWLAEGAGHSPDLIGKYGPIYRERIDRFLESYLTRRRSPDPAPSWSFARGGKAGEASGAKGSGVVQVRFPSAIDATRESKAPEWPGGSRLW